MLGPMARVAQNSSVSPSDNIGSEPNNSNGSSKDWNQNLTA